MSRIDRTLIASVSAAVLGWSAAGVATCWVVLNPKLHYAPVYLPWIHSFANVATISALVLVALRAFKRIVGETRQAYALGLEHGIDIVSSIAPLAPAAEDGRPGPETQEAPASAGASR